MEEKTTSFKKNANGSYSKKGVVRQTPKDGFVEHDGPGGLEYRKGHGVWWTYETDDPKVTRPFLYIFFALFMGIWNWIFYSCSQGMDPSGRMYVATVGLGINCFCLYVFSAACAIYASVKNSSRKPCKKKEKQSAGRKAKIKYSRKKRRDTSRGVIIFTSYSPHVAPNTL